MTAGVEVEPAEARALFGDHLDQARALAADLVEFGELLGLVGPLELERLWTRHLINCVLLAELLEPEARVVDVGSGAGLPGLVLAIARPDATLVLVEPMERRTEWLHDESERLGLRNVEVVRGRAQDVAELRGSSEQVTARAVSALSKLIPMSAPLLRPGGELMFLKGARVDEEIAAATKQIRAARLESVRSEVLGADRVTEPTRVFRARVPRLPD